MGNTNFHYEQRRLENERVILEVFDPAAHAAQFVRGITDNPDTLEYLSLPAFNSSEDFVKFYEENISSSLEECLYAILDKASIQDGRRSDEVFAGVISLTATNKSKACTELGIIVFPAFQRTHVTTNAAGLLLMYALDPPSQGGLGLRRVEWQAHTENAASRRAALRLGFELEGILRWQRVVLANRRGIAVDELERRNGTKGESRGRHTAIYSIVWEEWDEKRIKLLSMMDGK
ncbi:uncharacterized protein PV09_05190 [Verruconis gallopava]|uniref:N-acetyltransferase domain-containing protein n=1 Tax=Verruconis gallopava TaxID=253628 RepID=A0A0D2A9Z5_9PEZI|nr:uncharacterized protein PV09_05190 [Verruconis gallopava]KIW03415.1 hypothetical protein PV09_05190 [Verruconis gallopava]